MRRFILLLLFIAIGAAAGSPFVYGVLFKQEMMRLVDVINSGGLIKLSVMDYKRGWAVSQAHIKVEPGTVFLDNPAMKPALAGNNASMVVDIQIQHGPLIYNPIEKRYALAYGSVSGFISLPDQIETVLYGKKSPNGFMQFDAVSSFKGNWFSQYKIPPITLPSTDVAGRWGGMDAVFHVDVKQDKLEKYYTKATINALEVRAEKPEAAEMIPNVNAQPITYENSMNNTHGYAFNSVFSTPSVVIVSGSTPVFALKNLKQVYTQKSNLSDNLLNIYSSLTLDTFSLINFPIHLNKSGIYFNIKNLNAKEYDELYDYATSIKRAMTEEELTKLQSLIPKIISPSSYLTIDIGMNTSDGVLVMNSKLSWPQLLSGQMNMQTLLMSANATVAMRISSALLDKMIAAYLEQPDQAQMVQQMIQQYLQAGYLLKDNNDYVTSIVYQNGSVKANGHDVKP